MDASRVLLVAVAIVGLGASTVLAQDRAIVAAQSARAPGPVKPWKNVRGFGRVLDLSTSPVVIDEPGLYAIDRDWEFPREAASVNSDLIRITADDVTLDLHGFTIVSNINALPLSTLLVISGARVELRNGSLSACCDGSVAVKSTGFGTKLHHLSMFSHETATFEGDGASLTDSSVSPRVELRFAGNSTLERNAISCNRGARCVRFLGDGNQMTDNKMVLFQGGGIGIVGDRNVVANTVIDLSNAVDAGEVVEVAGDSNIVRDNTVLLGGIANTIYVISGTTNTLDGNIAAPPNATDLPRSGMEFTANGNFYGDNRMSAQVPFSLGGTVQTDWGGNVGY
jgi:hypothetical protein